MLTLNRAKLTLLFETAETLTLFVSGNAYVKTVVWLFNCFFVPSPKYNNQRIRNRYNMKRILPLFILLLGACASQKHCEPSLKSALEDKFYIGTALSPWQLTGRDSMAHDVITRHFNAIVPENCMKSMYLQPREGEFRFREADAFVRFGEEYDMFVTGHCLIWHSQLPDWFFVDEAGNDVTPEVLRQRMKSHISTVVGRYKGRIKGWDVVNEAIMEDGSYRKSKFYQILGEEFIPLAFQYAHEADPDVELYYNDYNMYFPGKREAVCRLVRELKARGLRIDAVGMQGHVDMFGPSIEEFEASINAYAEAGVKVMITEFDMSALPSPWHRSANISDTLSYEQRMNPYTQGLPEEVSAQWNERMKQYFQLFIDHADDITRVTLWGVNDGNSWRNGFPIRGRTDYPLLFDRQNRPKPVVEQLINEQAKQKKRTRSKK